MHQYFIRRKLSSKSEIRFFSLSIINFFLILWEFSYFDLVLLYDWILKIILYIDQDGRVGGHGTHLPP